jgi:hypothetical protein
VAPTPRHGMILLLNNELEGMWKETAANYSEVPPRQFPGTQTACDKDGQLGAGGYSVS